MKDKELCKACKERFDKQNGELRVLDMCEECKTKTLLFILAPEDGKIH